MAIGLCCWLFALSASAYIFAALSRPFRRRIAAASLFCSFVFGIAAIVFIVAWIVRLAASEAYG